MVKIGKKTRRKNKQNKKFRQTYKQRGGEEDLTLTRWYRYGMIINGQSAENELGSF